MEFYVNNFPRLYMYTYIVPFSYKTLLLFREIRFATLRELRRIEYRQYSTD